MTSILEKGNYSLLSLIFRRRAVVALCVRNKQTKKKKSVNNIELPDRASHLLPCALKTKINIQKYGRPDFFRTKEIYIPSP